MGLLRDAIGSAVGSATGTNKVNNGFGGPRFPSMSSQRSGRSSQSSYRNSTSYDDQYDYATSPRSDYRRSTDSRRPRGLNEQYYSSTYDQESSYQRQYSPKSQYTETQDRDYLAPSNTPPAYSRYDYGTGMTGARSSSPRDSSFRPLALPQITYGKGQPFLRGYSDELRQFGITERDFITVLDKLNVAVIPNPENQIFQSAANLAGWFIPGMGAGLGLMAGQIGVGVATAFGHASLVAKVLSKANLELFIPNGLEICIGSANDVNNEVGMSGGMQQVPFGTTPQQSLAYYGDLIAPITQVLPPLQNAGRRDPIAMAGRALAGRENDKKMRKAQKGAAKGRSGGGDSLQKDLKWLMVRRVSPGAMDYWEKNLQKSNQALQDEQAQAQSQSFRR